MATPPTTRTVAARIQAAMEKAGKTPKGLADDTGIPRSTLLRRLTGEYSFTVTELSLLAPHLDLNVRDLLSDEPSVA